MKTVNLQQKILSRNDEIALDIFRRLSARGIFTVNMISSPGSGKTTILEKLIPLLVKHGLRIGVLEGDVQTENDARRIASLGVPVQQIITCGSCHLDAQMVEDHLEHLPLSDMDALIIENVGNLVCPSTYNLGEDEKIVVLSTAEGHDKPLKYPAVFRRAGVMLINKMDLVPFTDFEADQAVHFARGINPDITVLELSCRTGDGLQELAEWFISRITQKRELTGA